MFSPLLKQVLFYDNSSFYGIVLLHLLFEGIILQSCFWGFPRFSKRCYLTVMLLIFDINLSDTSDWIFVAKSQFAIKLF